jgi:hypothetical protein
VNGSFFKKENLDQPFLVESLLPVHLHDPANRNNQSGMFFLYNDLKSTLCEIGYEHYWLDMALTNGAVAAWALFSSLLFFIGCWAIADPPAH